MPLSNPITEPQVPQPIARDAEVTAAINAHSSATDPHTQYLLQAEGDARYRLISTALTDSDIPAAIARDSEVTAAINAHLAATDPHLQYATQARADERYGKIKKIVLLGVTANAEGGLVQIAHGLALSNIMSVNCLVQEIGGSWVAPMLPAAITAGLQFCLSVTSGHVHVHNIPGNSSRILSRSVRVVIDYQF